MTVGLPYSQAAILRNRDRGRVDFEVAEISKRGVLGFGTGHLYGGASRRASLSLLHAAWDAGVTWFDTAPLYGHGEAESILGDALRGRRSGATIVSKVGIDPVRITLPYRVHALSARLAAKIPGMRQLVSAPEPLSPRFHQFSPDTVGATVDRSLQALRTDYIDLLLLHECTPEEATDSTLLETLEALKRQGKIRAYGTATSNEATAAIAARQGAAFDAFQFAFHVDGAPETPAGAPLIIHSVLGPRIKQLENLLVTDPMARARAAALGIDPERADLARRLMSAAARMRNVAAVLFSTSRIDRVAMLAGAAAEVSDTDAVAGLEFARWGIAHSADMAADPKR